MSKFLDLQIIIDFKENTSIGHDDYIDCIKKEFLKINNTYSNNDAKNVLYLLLHLQP